jgi:hypothetical protein
VTLNRSDLALILQEMAAMYPAVLFNEFMVTGYHRVLKSFTTEAVRRACLQLMGDELRKNFMPSAAEIKAVARGHEADEEETQRYLPCQQPGCKALIAWPPVHDKPDKDGSAEYRMFCPLHRPRHSHPATMEEKVEIAKALTPKARAFLRSSLQSVAPQVMAGIPVTREEAAWAEPEDQYRLVKSTKPVPDDVIAEVYGVSAAEVQQAQANASTRTLAPL